MSMTNVLETGVSSGGAHAVEGEDTSARDFADLRDMLDALKPSPRRRWAVMEREDPSARHATSCRHLVVWPPCGVPLPEFQVKRSGGKIEVTAFEESGAVSVCRFSSMPAMLAKLRCELDARLTSLEPSRRCKTVLSR